MILGFLVMITPKTSYINIYEYHPWSVVRSFHPESLVVFHNRNPESVYLCGRCGFRGGKGHLGINDLKPQPRHQLWWLNKYYYMGMDQYLLILFLGGWTSIYQLFWCSLGYQGFDPYPYGQLNKWGLHHFWIGCAKYVRTHVSDVCWDLPYSPS